MDVLMLSPVFGEIDGDPQDNAVVMRATWEYVAEKGPWLRAMCLNSAKGCPDRADELMSDFVIPLIPRLLVKWDGVRDFSNFVARNVVWTLHKQNLQSQKRFRQSSENFDFETIPDRSSKENFDQMLSEEVNNMMSILAPIDRVIFVLSKGHGYSYREIAVAVKKSYGYVAGSVTRSLDKLQKAASSERP